MHAAVCVLMLITNHAIHERHLRHGPGTWQHSKRSWLSCYLRSLRSLSSTRPKNTNAKVNILGITATNSIHEACAGPCTNASTAIDVAVMCRCFGESNAGAAAPRDDQVEDLSKFNCRQAEA